MPAENSADDNQASVKRKKKASSVVLAIAFLLLFVIIGTFFALNKENLLQFLVWLEETSLHLQIACFAFLYFVTSLPMMAGCIVLNVAAGTFTSVTSQM